MEMDIIDTLNLCNAKSPVPHWHDAPELLVVDAEVRGNLHGARGALWNVAEGAVAEDRAATDRPMSSAIFSGRLIVTRGYTTGYT